MIRQSDGQKKKKDQHIKVFHPKDLQLALGSFVFFLLGPIGQLNTKNPDKQYSSPFKYDLN